MVNAPGYSPWGPVQSSTKVAEGLFWVGTAGHGGLWVAPELRPRLKVQETRYSKGGFFEEDCDWALVAVSLPEFFSEKELEAARMTLKHCYGGKYACV